MVLDSMGLFSNNPMDQPVCRTWPRRASAILAGLGIGVGLSVANLRTPDPSAAVVSEPSLARTRPLAIPTPRATRDVPVWRQIGLASWYGPQFQGKETASGDTFNMHDLTCAHRSLPLGTWLKVTNLHNHKWIVVRVNDRGPVPETRIADLSSAAARMLGMRGRGVTRVRLDVIDPQQAREVARLEQLRLRRLAAEASMQTDTGN
jgi:rare lipoprotein A